MAMFNYKVLRILAEIGNKGNTAKRLTLTSWNGAPAKLDLRNWITDQEPAQPCKGLTLTGEEAEELAEALTRYLKE